MRSLALSILVLVGCDGGSAPVSAHGGGGDEDHGACAESDNDAMRLRLASTCASCHGVGASRPFFATLSAFEDLLAYDARYVVRGDPDASPLVALLEGRSTGAYAQMPLAGDSFVALAARGATEVTMDEVRAWIRDLPPPPTGRDGPDPDATTVRRLSADEAINALEIALGQEPHAGVPPLLRVDGIAPLAPDSPTRIDYQDAARRQAYLMLGGPSYLEQRMPEPTWSPSSLITWTQLVQGACVSAVDARSEALFARATPTASLPDDEADIRANVAYLRERFLHETASETDVDALFTRVFVPASASSTRDGWVQVCTALARDPLFITF
ncbi:MAG: hypothetical protein M3Y87_17345 [Myxococcota bacterium]|nr:hypothetical protein [Myxococcota bacterium]